MGSVHEVRIAKRTGFCYGVREAIDKAKESAAAGKLTHTLGQVVHNEGVIRDLQNIGVRSVDTLDDVDHGAAVVIRAHGVRPEVIERAERRGLDVIDGTCTWVIQEQRQLAGAGRGRLHDRAARARPGTPRWSGSWASRPDAIVVDEEEDWDRIPRRKRMALITQSTQPPWKFEKLAAFLVSRAHELKIVNTVCPVTIRRQEDTLETAREVDLMVVVGGRHSANTKELTRLCEIAGTRSGPGRERAGPRRSGGVRRRARRRRDRRHLDADRGSARRGRADPPARGHRGGQRQRAAEPRTQRARCRRALRPAGRPRCRRSRRRPSARADRAAGLPWRLSARAARSGLPIVALVGRPNVGKSTLFNRIVGDARAAIVEDRARTTRDRLYGDAEWNGRRFVVVDTGGLEVAPDDPIEAQVQLQARLAINEADVIVFVVDAATGSTPADDGCGRAAAADDEAGAGGRQQGGQRAPGARGGRVLRASAGRTRSRSPPATAGASRTCSTRWSGRCRPRARPRSPARRARRRPRRGRPRWPRAGPSRTSSATRPTRPTKATRTTTDADGAARARDVDEIAARWDAAMAAEDDEPPAIAFVGRPNVGKSSLLNALLG